MRRDIHKKYTILNKHRLSLQKNSEQMEFCRIHKKKKFLICFLTDCMVSRCRDSGSSLYD
ncbi:hypothetical protein PAHAL_2G279500 [Panicum hallii]|uniref:Uncharacterized protein n=1 Tax=Panicum hallii TaxID=206008 RepID=A0A2T8KQK3_9POAL|nr:hypothetical protein PAHAL_2G279500 [Panicum hallii]